MVSWYREEKVDEVALCEHVGAGRDREDTTRAGCLPLLRAFRVNAFRRMLKLLIRNDLRRRS